MARVLRVSFVLCLLQTVAAAAPPNVVVFLADDAGWGDYSGNGNPLVQTPHIDSIAREGVTVDRFYVCPVCAPTRAEFLTGRYHLRGGVLGVSTGFERLDLDEITLADSFSRAGYATGAFGKWHNGSQWPYHPMARGFDEYYGHTSGHWGEYFDPPLEHNGKMVRDRGYLVDLCTDRALDFIDRHHQQPFFCYIPFSTPHSPWAVPEEYWQRMKGREIPLPATLPDREVPEQTWCALAMLENQDWNVGRVLSRLEQHGIAENTIVVYFSDNGPNSWRWNGGMKGRKGQTDEGGVRSPCWIRWTKGLPAGHLVTPIAGAIDLCPTLTSLAGIKHVGEKPLDGRDLSPLLKGETVDWPDRMIFSCWGGNVSVRTQQYRLDREGKLFDLLSDPGQQQPVSDQRAIRHRLRSAVQDWKDEMKQISRQQQAVDPRPIPVGFPEFPVTLLPARDAAPHGNVQRSSRAPNCSYFVNWSSPDDRIIWQLDVVTTGRYLVTIDYTCPLDDVGAELELRFRQNQLKGRVETGWDPPLYTNQDTIPRPPGESQMKEFRTMELGEVPLEKGQGELVLRALSVPGQVVMDLRRITLTLLDPQHRSDSADANENPDARKP